MSGRKSSAEKEARLEEALGKLVEARQENARLREELARASAARDPNGKVVPFRGRRR